MASGTPSASGRRSSSIVISTPLRSAMWRASVATPSLTSIIALAPAAASARPASSRGSGGGGGSARAPLFAGGALAQRERLVLGGAPTAQQLEPGPRSAQLAGHAHEVAGPRPAAPHHVVDRGGPAGHRHRHVQRRPAHHVAPGDRGRAAVGQRADPLDQLQRAVLPEPL